jgi:hypothetical protein
MTAGQVGRHAGALLQYQFATGEKALTNVQTEVQNTVAELERVVAISYPLIEYVVLRIRQEAGGVSEANTGDSAYKFLTRVIWNDDDRQQEVLQVASAAFGPLGVIALAAIQNGSGKTSVNQNSTGERSQGRAADDSLEHGGRPRTTPASTGSQKSRGGS